MRGASIDNGPINVMGTGRTGGPYSYIDLNSPIFPLSPWMRMVSKSYSSEGQEVSAVRQHLLLAGIIGSWGSFQYEDRERVMTKISDFPAILSGQLWSFLFPSRAFFTGTQGYFWSGPLWLFGHVSSDTSQTLMLLGIPIRYWNTEEPGNS